MKNKPISMMINETKLSLIDICNKSNLPPCILEPIVKDLYDDVIRAASVQLKQDEERYLQEQKESTQPTE